MAGTRALLAIGSSGAGKSTLAAALCAAGASLLTENVAVIDGVAGRPAVRSGYAYIGVDPSALKAMGHPLDLPRVLPHLNDDKRAVSATRSGRT